MTEQELRSAIDTGRKIERVHRRIQLGMRRLSKPKIWLPKEPISFRRRVYNRVCGFVWKMLGQP